MATTTSDNMFTLLAKQNRLLGGTGATPSDTVFTLLAKTNLLLGGGSGGGGGSIVKEAPMDGKNYVRQNGLWVPIPAGVQITKIAGNVSGGVAITGNYTIPLWAVELEVWAYGAGSGGGSGAVQPVNTARSGGGGGASGGVSMCKFLVSEIGGPGAVLAYQVGCAGTPGASVPSASSANGITAAGGAVYQHTFFGNSNVAYALIMALGAQGGIGGTTTTAPGGVNSISIGSWMGVAGGQGTSAATGANGGNPTGTKAGGGGGGGGGVNASEAQFAGGTGGPMCQDTRNSAGAGTGGALGGGNGGNAGYGLAPITGSGGGAGGGGGGGSNQSGVPGGTGGNASAYGAGGGGGGAGTTGVCASGAGGLGGAGLLIIIARG